MCNLVCAMLLQVGVQDTPSRYMALAGTPVNYPCHDTYTCLLVFGKLSDA